MGSHTSGTRGSREDSTGRRDVRDDGEGRIVVHHTQWIQIETIPPIVIKVCVA